MGQMQQSTGSFSATLRLTIGELAVAHPITVPSASVPATDIVPALQGLVNAVVSAAEAGRVVSCTKGCGACCRQVVPVSRTEGERLLQLVEAMPAERRARIEQRFAAAEAVLTPAGLAACGDRTDREFSLAYFAQRVPCPFLEEESCSIHAERPLICREYLVSSPAELCAGPSQEGVTPLPVPKISLAARALQDEHDGWFPLAMLMAWGRIRPTASARRPGVEWLKRFIGRLGK